MGMTEKQKRKYHNRIKKINLVDAPIKPLDNELWRPMKEHENEFLVSSKGRIYNIQKARLARTFKAKDGYEHFWSGDIKTSVHKLVATHFLRNTLKKPVVNHKDESRDNNDVENLEWVTYQENYHYGTSAMRHDHNLTKYFDILMIDPGTNQVVMSFETIADAVDFLEGDELVTDEQSAHSAICAAVNDKAKIAYGYQWEALIVSR